MVHHRAAAPHNPRGVARANDRRVLNGIYWRLRTGSPWADIPERYGVEFASEAARTIVAARASFTSGSCSRRQYALSSSRT